MIAILASSTDDAMRAFETFCLHKGVAAGVCAASDLEASVRLNPGQAPDVRINLCGEPVTAVINRSNMNTVKSSPTAEFMAFENIAHAWAWIGLLRAPVINRPTKEAYFPQPDIHARGAPGILLPGRITWGALGASPCAGVRTFHRVYDGRSAHPSELMTFPLVETPYHPDDIGYALIAGKDCLDLETGEPDRHNLVQILHHDVRDDGALAVLVYQRSGAVLAILSIDFFPPMHAFDRFAGEVNAALLKFLQREST